MIAPQPAIEASNIYVFVLIPRHVKTRFGARSVLFEKFFRGKCFPAPAAKDSKAFISEASINIFTFGDLKIFLFRKKAFSLFIYRQVSMGLAFALCASVVSDLHTRFRAYRRVFPHIRCEERQTRAKKWRKI